MPSRRSTKGFGFSILVFILISFASYVSNDNLTKSAALVEHSSIIVQKLERIVSDMKDAETGQRGFLLTGRTEFLEPYTGSIKSASVITAEVRDLTRNNLQQKENLRQITRALEAQGTNLRQLVVKKRRHVLITMDDLEKDKHGMDVLRGSITRAEILEKGLLADDIRILRRFNILTPLMEGLAGLVALVIFIYAYLRSVRESKARDRLQYSLQTLNSELEGRVDQRTRALAASELSFRNMMESLPQIAWTNDTNGELIFYNKRWYEYTGLQKEDMTEWAWSSVIHELDRSLNKSRFEDILASNTRGEFEIREKRSDGQYRWHLIRMEPLEDENNEVMLWIGTATDIDDLKRLQVELDKKNNSLLRINADLDNFIHAASHDLLAPLSNIEVSIEVMNHLEVHDAEQNEILGIINSSVIKFRTLIQDIATIARLESDMITLEQVDLDEILNNVEWSLENKIKLSGAVLIRDLEVKHVLFSKKNLRSIVFNLVSNAIKFKREESPVIHITSKMQGDEIVLSVRDNGIGLSEQQVEKIFDIYGRINQNIEGQGIGLYLASKMVNAASGSISVESEAGKGSMFSLNLKALQEPVLT